VVCTGNVCRSPLAERVGAAHLGRLLGEDAGLIRVVSAGTRAVVGSDMDPASARALCELGGDPTGFRARQLADAMAVRADLTLTMTRSHRHEVLARAPRAMSRTFTLLEAAGLLELVGPDGAADACTPAERVRSLTRAMAAARCRRPSRGEDDVLDPIGLPEEVHAQVGRVIADAIVPVLDRIATAVLGAEPAWPEIEQSRS
jgi:protein-tyrosine-phosphatase